MDAREKKVVCAVAIISHKVTWHIDSTLLGLTAVKTGLINLQYYDCALYIYMCVQHSDTIEEAHNMLVCKYYIKIRLMVEIRLLIVDL